MKDVNYPLRKVYYAALNGNITYNSTLVRSFYQKAPDNITDSYYIVFAGITNNDVSSKQKSDTETSIRVTIHTHETKYNDGRAADDIARQIFNLVYPDKLNRPDLSADGLQIVNTRLQSDFPINYSVQGAQEYIDRVLTFVHRIYHY